MSEPINVLDGQITLSAATDNRTRLTVYGNLVGAERASADVAVTVVQGDLVKLAFALLGRCKPTALIVRAARLLRGELDGARPATLDGGAGEERAVIVEQLKRIAGALEAGAVRAPVVHWMAEGRSRCGMPGAPRDWPPGHSWSAQLLEVTCASCTRGHSREEPPP